MPNGQQPVKQTWPEIVEGLKIAIHNSSISLELMKAQLKEAEAHARGS